jgi:flagellar protein FlaG
MSNTAPISGIVPDVASAQPAQAPTPAGAGTSQAPATPTGSQADTRLVIEDDKAAGSYVYVTINPATGKVISQVPREQLLKMREDPDYRPGSVVNSVG